MKLLKKLMAGAMAIAMLSAYTVAFATSTISGTVSGGSSSEVTLKGDFGGQEVFLMKMPTAAANSALTFTVDPKEAIHNSPPENATGNSTYGTVVFSTKSGSDVTYTNKSAPLQVISMSSTDVTVNMIATLTNTKMTFSTTSGFSTAKEHLYLGVQVATLSGGSANNEGTPLPVTEMGAMQATTLKAVAGNFVSLQSGGTIKLVSGAGSTSQNAEYAARITDDKWTGVQYTVIGYSNPAADWQIAQLAAPELHIKWVVDTADEVTYAPGTPSGSNYTVKLDKAKYKASENATIYVKPTSEEAKLSSVTLNYIAVNATTGKTSEQKSVRGSVNSTPVNGVYSATVVWPSDMARPETPVGDSPYAGPTWEIEVG